MQISNGVVATFHYTLTNDRGETLDSSIENDPLSYIHGAGMIIPGLEEQLVGKIAGEKFSVSVEPDGGYGERDEGLIQTIAHDEFPTDQALEPGMQFHAESDHGTQIVTILEVKDEGIRVDTNHPLAGERLNFEVEILEVRAATEDELSHGHVHGPGGHH